MIKPEEANEIKPIMLWDEWSCWLEIEDVKLREEICEAHNERVQQAYAAGKAAGKG